MKLLQIKTSTIAIAIALVSAMLFTPMEVWAELPTMKPPSGGDSKDLFGTATDWGIAIMKWAIYLVGAALYVGVGFGLFRRYMAWNNKEDKEGVGGLLLSFGVGIGVIVFATWLLNLGLEVIESSST